MMERLHWCGFDFMDVVDKFLSVVGRSYCPIRPCQSNNQIPGQGTGDSFTTIVFCGAIRIICGKVVKSRFLRTFSFIVDSTFFYSPLESAFRYRIFSIFTDIADISVIASIFT